MSTYSEQAFESRGRLMPGFTGKSFSDGVTLADVKAAWDDLHDYVSARSIALRDLEALIRGSEPREPLVELPKLECTTDVTVREATA